MWSTGKICKDNYNNNSTIRSPRLKQRRYKFLTKDKAARIIQRAYQRYKMRKKYKQTQALSPKSSPREYSSPRHSTSPRHISPLYRKPSPRQKPSPRHRPSPRHQMLPNHQMLPTHQILPKHQTLAKHQMLPNRQMLAKRQMLSMYQQDTSSDQQMSVKEFPWKTNQKVVNLFKKMENLETKYGQMNKSSSSEVNERFSDTSLFIYDRESVLVFGGIDPHSDFGVGRNNGKDIYRYIADRNIWEFVGQMPEPRHHHCVAFLKGKVFIVGGADPREEDCKGKAIVVDTAWSFDPLSRIWCKEPSLGYKRKNFGLVVSEKYLFAIGGQGSQGRTLASVERLNVLSGNWEKCASMLHSRMGVACAKFEEKIWAAGGMSGSKKQPLPNSVECYDIDKNQWTEIGKLRHPRCFGSLFTMSNKLYLIGGAGRIHTKDKTTTSLASIDLWNSNVKEWEKVSEMTIPRHGHAVAYLGTQILIIGGVTTIYMRALSNIECFCGSRGSWIRGIAPLPTYLSGHAALTLPPGKLV